MKLTLSRIEQPRLLVASCSVEKVCPLQVISLLWQLRAWKARFAQCRWRIVQGRPRCSVGWNCWVQASRQIFRLQRIRCSSAPQSYRWIWRRHVDRRLSFPLGQVGFSIPRLCWIERRC